MKTKNTLYTLILAATIGLSSCNNKPTLAEIAEKEKQSNISIYGKPVSVAYTPATHLEYEAFAAVFNVKEKILLVYRGERNTASSLSLVESSALIQSEINDLDDDSVKLTGQYRGNKFELSSIEINGYKVNLGE